MNPVLSRFHACFGFTVVQLCAAVAAWFVGYSVVVAWILYTTTYADVSVQCPHSNLWIYMATAYVVYMSICIIWACRSSACRSSATRTLTVMFLLSANDSWYVPYTYVRTICTTAVVVWGYVEITNTCVVHTMYNTMIYKAAYVYLISETISCVFVLAVCAALYESSYNTRVAHNAAQQQVV